MGWLMQLPFVFSVLILAHTAGTAVCKSSCASSTPQQQQGGGSEHSANGGGPDYLMDYDHGEFHAAAQVSFSPSGVSPGTGGSKPSVTVAELEECNLCNRSLHRDGSLVHASSPEFRLCRACLATSSKKVDWTTKDSIAVDIAIVVLKTYVGAPRLPMPDEFPCVECLMFMLEMRSSATEHYDIVQGLELCGMCLWEDGRVAGNVTTFTSYYLASFYLKLHIEPGFPPDDDDSELAKLLRIIQSPHKADWMEAFYDEFMFDEDVFSLAQDSFGACGCLDSTQIWQRAAAIIKHILYPSKQRVKPLVAPAMPTNKVPPAKGASTTTGAQSHGIQGRSKGKPSPAKTGPVVASARKSSISGISGARNSTLQPAYNKSDVAESKKKVERFMHKYRLLSKYFVHDARDTPIECAWLAYFGLCFVISLLAVPALWLRYLRALDRHARKGRRPLQSLFGFVRFACVDCITIIKQVLTTTKRFVQVVFTARCLAWFGSVLLLLALCRYACIHSGSVQQHTLATYMPYVLLVTAASCTCISFPMLVNRLLCQPMLWCLLMPVTLGRRLGDVMSQPLQQHDTVHSIGLDCDSGGGYDSKRGQHTTNKQPQPRHRSKGRKGRNKRNSTPMHSCSSPCSNDSTSRGASSSGGTQIMANNTATNDNTVGSNSNAGGESMEVAADLHLDKVPASEPQQRSTITVCSTTVQQTTKAPSHMAGTTQPTASPEQGSQQEIKGPVDQLLLGKDFHVHAPTAATTSAPPATIMPTTTTLAASSPSRLPPVKAHVAAAHPAKATEATTASTQSAVTPPKALPPAQSVAVRSEYGLSQHACDDAAGDSRLHSSCNRVESNVGRATQVHGFTAGNPQTASSSTLKLPGNKAEAATTSTMSSPASANASDGGWQRLGGGDSSNKRDVAATSGPHIHTPYRPLVLTSPTTSSTARSMPPSDPVVGVTAPDVKESSLLAPYSAIRGPPVPGNLTVPPVNASAVSTAPLVLPPPLQLDSLAMATTPAPAAPAEVTPTVGPAIGSDSSSDAGGAGLCVICWDGELTHGLMHDDCIHLCMCSECSAKYDHDAHGCPVCRRAGELIEL